MKKKNQKPTKLQTMKTEAKTALDIAQLRSQVIELQKASAHYQLCLQGQGHINETQRKRLSELETLVLAMKKDSYSFAALLGIEFGKMDERLNAHESDLDTIDEGFIAINAFAGNVEKDLSALASDVTSLALSRSNQELCNTYELNRLNEICDYFNLERVPYWRFNEGTSLFETGHMLRVKTPEVRG